MDFVVIGAKIHELQKKLTSGAPNKEPQDERLARLNVMESNYGGCCPQELSQLTKWTSGSNFFYHSSKYRLKRAWLQVKIKLFLKIVITLCQPHTNSPQSVLFLPELVLSGWVSQSELLNKYSVGVCLILQMCSVIWNWSKHEQKESISGVVFLAQLISAGIIAGINIKSWLICGNPPFWNPQEKCRRSAYNDLNC